MGRRISILLGIAALALAGCGRNDGGNNLAALDNQLVGNDADPALTSALADQIAVDPSLANQSNRNAVRPPETPTQAPYPADDAAPAKKGAAPVQTASAQTGGNPCANDAPFDYKGDWANRLSPAFPVYPGAKVTEAAGRDQPGCRMRVVTFTTGDNWQRVLDWYGAQAARAGYSADHQLRGGDHVLAGTNDRDGGAFYLIVTPARAGSDVSLIANNGR